MKWFALDFDKTKRQHKQIKTILHLPLVEQKLVILQTTESNSVFQMGSSRFSVVFCWSLGFSVMVVPLFFCFEPWCFPCSFVLSYSATAVLVFWGKVLQLFLSFVSWWCCCSFVFIHGVAIVLMFWVLVLSKFCCFESRYCHQSFVFSYGVVVVLVFWVMVLSLSFGFE